MKIIEILAQPKPVKPVDAWASFRGQQHPTTGTDTPEFQAWFRRSRVCNPDGSPRVVYHGTASIFDTFDHQHGGAATDASDAGLGFWFSDSTARASAAATDAAQSQHDAEIAGQQIIPVYLRIEKPKVFKGLLPDMEKSVQQIQVAVSAGNDGVIWLAGERNSWGFATGTTYLVFQPNQIKSIHNRRPTDGPSIMEASL